MKLLDLELKLAEARRFGAHDQTPIYVRDGSEPYELVEAEEVLIENIGGTAVVIS